MTINYSYLVLIKHLSSSLSVSFICLFTILTKFSRLQNPLIALVMRSIGSCKLSSVRVGRYRETVTLA